MLRYAHLGEPLAEGGAAELLVVLRHLEHLGARAERARVSDAPEVLAGRNVRVEHLADRAAERQVCVRDDSRAHERAAQGGRRLGNRLAAPRLADGFHRRRSGFVQERAALQEHRVRHVVARQVCAQLLQQVLAHRVAGTERPHKGRRDVTAPVLPEVVVRVHDVDKRLERLLVVEREPIRECGGSWRRLHVCSPAYPCGGDHSIASSFNNTQRTA